MDLKRLFSILAVLVLVGAAVFILYRDREEIEKNSTAPSFTGGTNISNNITLQGEYVCLPKKGDGPHTLECAFGIRTAEGNHYSLSMNPGMPNIQNIPTGSHIRVTGLLVPIEAISTDTWRSYDIQGIISVETFEVK